MNQKTHYVVVLLILILSGTFCTKDRKWETTNLSDICIEDMIWGNSMFFAISNDAYYNTKLLTSIDGKNWVQKDLPIMNVNRIKWMNSQYVISFNKYSYNKTSFYTSFDGTTWNQIPDSVQLNYISDFTWDGQKYVAVGQVGYVSTSANLRNWVSSPLHDITLRFQKIYFFQGLYFSIGRTEKTKTGSDGTTSTDYGKSGLFTSSDGITWIEKKQFEGIEITSIIYGNQEFVASGLSGALFTSKNGRDWKNLSANPDLDILHMDWNGTDYVATMKNQSNLEVWHTLDFGFWSSYVFHNPDPLFSLYDEPSWSFQAVSSGNGMVLVSSYSFSTNYDNCESYILKSKTRN